MPADELAFGLGGEETGVVALLLLHRLLLLRYVVVVGHAIGILLPSLLSPLNLFFYSQQLQLGLFCFCCSC